MSATKRVRDANNTWSLQDAKARLSEVVRLAQEQGPQRVTIHGKEAAVMVGAEEYERLTKPKSGADLMKLLQESPHREVNLDFERVKMPIKTRDVEF